MSLTILHPVRLTLYMLLSLADLALTYALIQQGGGEVYESNPIAEAWLSSYGWTGLALYKLVIIVIVAVVAAFVSLSRPRTGGHILTFACLAVAVVVTYSVHLSFAEQLHARFIRSPVANTAPSVPRQVYRVAWGIAPVMAGFDFSPARQIEKRP
jgi:hypothetical protein